MSAIMTSPAHQSDHKKALQQIKSRIVQVIPPGSAYLETFLKCATIEWTETMSTAAISSDARGLHLRFNRDFIETYCTLDEDLMMLVLHELHHVLYGHMSLFKNKGLAHNIAFDAIINARLCRHWKTRRHSHFFVNYYKDGRFPAFLLAPPPEWPGEPNENAKGKELAKLEEELPPQKAKDVLACRDRLYYTPDLLVDYQEILALLEDDSMKKSLQNAPPLLGSHGQASSHQRESVQEESAQEESVQEEDPLLTKLSREMDESFASCSGGRNPFNLEFKKNKVNVRRTFLSALHKFLIKAGLYGHSRRSMKKFEFRDSKMPVDAVIPQWKDRTLLSRECLWNFQPLLYQDTQLEKQRNQIFVGNVHIYLDVSGSMNRNLRWMIRALAPLEKAGFCRIFLFSTKVFDAPAQGIAKGPLKTTGGTDVTCVFLDINNMDPKKRPEKVVIITDGYFWKPKAKIMKAFNETKVRLYAAITHDGSTDTAKEIAYATTQLPPHR